MSSKARGNGVGKRLFQDLLAYVRSQDINRFYLFTDTSCNYGFYEHQGLVRCGKREKEFEFGPQSGMWNSTSTNIECREPKIQLSTKNQTIALPIFRKHRKEAPDHCRRPEDRFPESLRYRGMILIQLQAYKSTRQEQVLLYRS